MVNSTIVRRDTVSVEVQAFLHCEKNEHVSQVQPIGRLYVHLLKLVTGVESSTRLVRSAGKEGKTAKRRSRTSDAPVKRAMVCLSKLMAIESLLGTCHCGGKLHADLLFYC